MRHFTKLVAFIILILFLLPNSTYAANIVDSAQSIIYYDDGSYMIIEIGYIDTRAVSTRVGYKTYTRYRSDDVIQWKATLSATFEYDNSTAICLTSNCEVEISDSNWYLESKSASKSGATATAQVSMSRKFLGLKVNTETIDLSLTCTPNGDFV